MGLAEGTVSVLDKEGVVFTRIWCGYEVYVSLAAPPDSKMVPDESGDDGLTPYKWVVYTALEAVVRAEDDGRLVPRWKKGDPVPAVGIADGPAPCDSGAAPFKQQREAYFPLALAGKALGITLETAQASVAADKTHILNAMSGEKDNFDMPPPERHAMYDELNETLRGRFAAGSFRRAVEQADAGVVRGFCAALSKGRMRNLPLDLKACDRFTPNIAGQLGAALGRECRAEKLELVFDDEKDVLMAALVAALPEGALPTCETLDLSCNEFGDAGATALAAALDAGALPACRELVLSANKIGDAGYEALAAALDAGALPKCKEINLFNNKASQRGEGAVKAAAKKRSIELPYIDD